jgi:micrococcal nuclease
MRTIRLICILALATLPFSAAAGSHGKEGRIVSVIDGDGVMLRLGQENVAARLIGIDAPEMGQEPWGARARDHLRSLLKAARWRVHVETDMTQRDKYDRLLVYLWTADGSFINERMLRQGYAVLFTVPPNTRFVDRFTKAQAAARQEQLGIWGPAGLREQPREYKKAHPRR